MHFVARIRCNRLRCPLATLATLVATRLGRDSETRGEKNPSHMENHTKCISSSCFWLCFWSVAWWEWLRFLSFAAGFGAYCNEDCETNYKTTGLL